MFSATIKALSDENVKQRLAGGGAEIVVSASPSEFGAYVASETKKWERVVKDSGATAD